MKNIFFTAIFLLPFVMMSCQKEAINNSANLVKVTAQGASDETLKTAIINSSVDWVGTADHVGFFSDRAYTLTPSGPATNVDYFAQTAGHSVVLTSSTSVYWDGTTTPHGFAAYYPYIPGATNYLAVPISLPSSQTQTGTTTDHIGALDFTVATPFFLTPVPGANPTVNFLFNHVFSVLKFDLTCTAPRTLSSISVTISGAGAPNISLTSGTIDITQTRAAGVPYTISAAIGGLNVILNTSLALSGTVVSAYMVILPGDATGKTFTIVYTSSTGATFQVIKPGMIFERGKVYTIQQTIPVGLGGF